MRGVYVTPNPWIWEANDVFGRTLSITIPWNSKNRTLQNATVSRESGCLISTVLIGLGTDGTPDTAQNSYFVPEGTSQVTGKMFARNGLTNIDDVEALGQITAS